MLNENTLSKMKEMNLTGMYEAFKTQQNLHENANMTIDQVIAMLVDAEFDHKQNKRLALRLAIAKLRYPASVEQIDFNANRTLDKNLFLRLTDCNFIKQSENIVITGMTGTGKSYLACAVGHQACLNGYKVLYSNFGKLLTKLKMAKADNSYLREIIKISNFDLLILDDFGLQTMDHSANISLLEILEDRYGNRSTIIASQIPSENWYELFENPTIADACLDRIIHNAYKLNLEGESMRKTIKTTCSKRK